MLKFLQNIYRKIYLEKRAKHNNYIFLIFKKQFIFLYSTFYGVLKTFYDVLYNWLINQKNKILVCYENTLDKY